MPSIKSELKKKIKKGLKKSKGRREKYSILLFGGFIFLSVCFFASSIILLIFKELEESGEYMEIFGASKPSIHITRPTGKKWFSTTKDKIRVSGICFDEGDDLEQVEYSVNDSAVKTAYGVYEWQTGDLELKDGQNIIEVSVVDAQGNRSFVNIHIIRNTFSDFYIKPSVYPQTVYRGSDSKDVVVKAGIRLLNSQDIHSVTVHKSNEQGEILESEIMMNDDGNLGFGDDIPQDSIYSTKFSVVNDYEGKQYFIIVVKTEDFTDVSEVLTVEIKSSLSDAQWNTVQTVNNEILDFIDSSESRGIDSDKVVNNIMSMLSQKDAITEFGRTDGGSIWWIFKDSCVLSGFLNNPASSKGGVVVERQTLLDLVEPESSSEVLGELGERFTLPNKNAISLNPFLEEFSKYDDYYGGWDILKGEKELGLSYSEKFDRSVTVDDFKDLSEYGVILISSHGDSWYKAYDGKNQCLANFTHEQEIIQTNQTITNTNISYFKDDLINQRLAIDVNGKAIIMPSLISHYNDFPDSMVHVSSCNSVNQGSLATAFLGNGAISYVGFTEYVRLNYAKGAGENLLTNFFVNRQSLGTAFDKTLESIGDEDLNGARMVLLGDRGLIIRNKIKMMESFEDPLLSGWNKTGDIRVVSKLGPIHPTHEKLMGIVSTGLGSNTDNDSSLTMRLDPNSFSKISFDFNLVSEEPDEFLFSDFDDQFNVYIKGDDFLDPIVQYSVNDLDWNRLEGIDFYGGDETVFQTGWTSYSHTFDFTRDTSSVELVFQVSDVGDSSFDTLVLLDNIVFEE